ADGTPGLDDGTGIWAAGTLHFGTRDQTSDTNSRRFSTDGLSVGVDRRFGDKLALGIGVGYARDRTDIGSDGTMSRARGSSIAVYGSYQPTRNTFIDGLIGYGVLDIDTDRFVPSVTDFARGHREGNQLFGSIAAGYEHRREGLLLSPYGRLDFGRDRLKEYTETGAGLNALTYFEQTQRALQLSLGVRAESAHETSFGWALPRLRVEFKHDFEGNRDATIAYADQFAGPRFSVTPAGVKRDSLVVNFGSDFLFAGGLKFGVDYQFQRTIGPDRSQAIRFWLSKELDGKGPPAGLVSVRTFDDPVRVEAALTLDDNVNRARDGADKIGDDAYSVNVSKSMIFPTGSNSRVLVTGFLNGEKLRRTVGLERVSGGAQGEFQYRTSGDFGAPTFGVFGRAVFDDYHSQLRSGYRTSLGVNYRQALTDCIDLFAALAGNRRHAESTVFDARDWAFRFNLDYSLGRTGAVYLGGEYRRGDTVTSAPVSLAYGDLAKASAPDDAYVGRGLVAYRYEAKTVLWTLGYNRPLGARDSIDFSWRRAEATPTSSGATGLYSAGGGSRYYANQYSIAYLMRF
ncbi:MAG: autotransporter outer membrane beta-barrel domain-containing protein, partial [Burkholderiales bacterium]